MDCTNCIQEERIKAIEQELKNQARESNDSKVNMMAMSIKLDNLMDFMKKVDTRLEKAEAEPKKRWDSIVNSIIQAVVVIIVALIFKGGI